MLPCELQPGQFASYPPEARELVISHLDALRQLPLSFVPGLLREVIDYDYKFPAERSSIDNELAILSSLTGPQIDDWFRPFAQISLSSSLERFDWINLPAQFVEQESAYLWTTHQLDAFRKAATDYGARTQAKATPDSIPIARLGIAVIGQGVSSFDQPLFRNLRKQGTYFSQINPDNGLDRLLFSVSTRSKAHPVPYGHWYIDGGQEVAHGAELTCVSYERLEPVRAALLKRIRSEIARPGMGPEELRTHLARMKPSDLGVSAAGNAVLDLFQLKLLTEGSGTQVFSTTFAQWATREALRRAEPLTLLVRFAPRQQQRPINELLSGSRGNIQLDPMGSLVDADMAAYYHWINQQRLAGSERSCFLVWFEGHSQALAIGPTLPKGAESRSDIDLGKLLSLMEG